MNELVTKVLFDPKREALDLESVFERRPCERLFRRPKHMLLAAETTSVPQLNNYCVLPFAPQKMSWDSSNLVSNNSSNKPSN